MLQIWGESSKRGFILFFINLYQLTSEAMFLEMVQRLGAPADTQLVLIHFTVKSLKY